MQLIKKKRSNSKRDVDESKLAKKDKEKSSLRSNLIPTNSTTTAKIPFTNVQAVPTKV